VLAGKLTKEQADLEGTVRTADKLRSDDKGTLWIVVDKVEAVKKAGVKQPPAQDRGK
jgi:hypothetical protein